MSPEEYCYNKAAPKGSPLYFSARKLEGFHRDAVVAVCAFYKEIEDITLDYEDATIAQTKLNWWRDQITKLNSGRANHPIAQVLQKLMIPLSLNPQHFLSIIDGLEQNLALPQFTKFEEHVVHIMRTGGTREFLLAAILQENEVISQEALYQFALVIDLVNYLQHLRRYVHRGLIFFSQEELQQFKVTKTDLQEFKTTQNVQDLLKYQSEKIKKAYQKANELITPEQKKELSSLIIRSESACALLQAIQSSKYKVLENFINITPLHSWWISWKFSWNFSWI